MDQLFDFSLFNSMLRMIAPILLAALGGAICARVAFSTSVSKDSCSTGAFTAIVGNHLFHNVWLAVLFAAVCAGLLSLILAYLTISLNANMIVSSGAALNFLATGLTTYFLFAIFHVKGSYDDPNMTGLPKWNIPHISGDSFLGILTGHSPLVYLAFVLAFALQFFFFRTVRGFRMLAAGENPAAARSLGIKATASGTPRCSRAACCADWPARSCRSGR